MPEKRAGKEEGFGEAQNHEGPLRTEKEEGVKAGHCSPLKDQKVLENHEFPDLKSALCMIGKGNHAESNVVICISRLMASSPG